MRSAASPRWLRPASSRRGEAVRGTLRRLVVFLGVVFAGTAAVSAALGALAGKNLEHSLAVGFYVAGAAALVGSFLLGSRGPWRTEVHHDDVGATGFFGRRHMRKATPEERTEGRHHSLGLFALGIALVLVGAAIDPTRRVF